MDLPHATASTSRVPKPRPIDYSRQLSPVQGLPMISWIVGPWPRWETRSHAHEGLRHNHIQHLLGDTGYDGMEVATILGPRSACPPMNAAPLISGSLARPYPTLADTQADLTDGVGGENRSPSVSSPLLSCGGVGVLDLRRWRGILGCNVRACVNLGQGPL